MIRTASRNLNMFPVVAMNSYEVSQREVDEMIRDLELMEEANARENKSENRDSAIGIGKSYLTNHTFRWVK